MANYDVYVFCNECSKVHPMNIHVALDDGPVEKGSIGDLYAGKALPPAIANLINNETKCPNTGHLFTQKDNSQVFLVPIPE